MSLPDELKDALKAINRLRYVANKENIKLAQKKYRDAKRDDSEHMSKVRTYAINYYQTITKPKREADKEQAKAYYNNVVKPKHEALKLLQAKSE